MTTMTVEQIPDLELAQAVLTRLESILQAAQARNEHWYGRHAFHCVQIQKLLIERLQGDDGESSGVDRTGKRAELSEERSESSHDSERSISQDDVTSETEPAYAKPDRRSWHPQHKHCANCGKKDTPHLAKGFCRTCYYKERHRKRIEKERNS